MKETIYSEIKLCTMQYKNQDHYEKDTALANFLIIPIQSYKFQKLSNNN